jgi:hypothetical protein
MATIQTRYKYAALLLQQMLFLQRAANKQVQSCQTTTTYQVQETILASF